MPRHSTVLVTGCAGFIGYHVVQAMLREGHAVIGVDDMNAYYDTSLKQARLARLRDQHQGSEESFLFYEMDVADGSRLNELFESHAPTFVIHLAAQAGVRFSIDHPASYVHSNLTGFFQIIECCRLHGVAHLMYASSSSVYGMNRDMPLKASQSTAHPISLYAATKKSNELMAHAYSHLFNIPMTGLRFFSVYGPWGRPDMAYYKFTKAIVEGQTIDVYNHGDMYRDFTYIDDITDAICVLMRMPPQRGISSDTTHSPDASSAPYRVLNLGSGTTVHLPTFIQAIESALGMRADIQYMPLQPGDVYQTYADVSPLHALIGERETTKIEDGVPQFVDWFRSYHKV